MKKISLFLVLLILFGYTYGKHIDENTAKKVGQAFLSNRTNSQILKSTVNLQLAYKANFQLSNVTASIQTLTLFYIFNAGSNGFIIVAGDDNVTPILGYSDKGAFDPGNLPPNVAKWLEGYKNEIRYIITNNVPANHEITEAWDAIRNGRKSNNSFSSNASVNPLLQTQWNQSPFYNDLCPGESVTGCVATAMAQIMKYWNYPATGSGFHSYNHRTYGTLSANFGGTTYQWSSMPNVVNNSNNAVATLMYQVGVSVDMNYSPQVSGAYVISAQSPITNCSEYALKTYFGYKNTLRGLERAYYSEEEWINILKTEFGAGRPVLYAGFGNGGGHCFVADGYDNNDYIHFNWGWGGYYDGYFQINALNPDGLGTGGGSGEYNSGQQAVIGIEPPTGNQTYDLALYNYVTPSSSTIGYGQSFTISTNIANYGTGAFNGDYAAAIFDTSYKFIDFVQTLTGYSLEGGYAYNSDLVFSTTGLLTMLPGTYYIGIFYRPTGENWIQVANSGSFVNLIQITVKYSNDIELNSSMVVNPGTTLTQGQAASVNLNILNVGTSTFTGQYAVGLYNLDGSWAQTIEIIDENNGLPSNYTYESPYLTFSTSFVSVDPGTYLLAVQHNPNNTGWQLTGSTYYLNPIKVTVIEPSLDPDNFEANNTMDQSYLLPIAFSENEATIITTGSNCHITTDNDFYKVELPSGYNYTLTSRIHDSYNSSDGNTYTLDGLFSYSTNGIIWSDAFDDVMTGNIVMNGGGTVYFRVAPYFAGGTGTYSLSIAIHRISLVGIHDDQTEANISIYPNPAKDFILVDFNDFNGIINQLNVLNMQGQNVFTTNTIDQSGIFSIPLTNLSDGMYTLLLQTSNGILTKKIIVRK